MTSATRSHIPLRHLDVNLQGKQATTSNTRQTNITTFATPTHRRCDADRSQKITQPISEMTARDLLPLCFVEGKGFHKLIHYTEPEYTVPTDFVD